MAEQASSKRGAIIALVVLVVVLVLAWMGYLAVSKTAGNASNGALSGAASTAQPTAGGERHWNNGPLSSVTIADSEGYPITLGTLCDGKPAIINVWATWCPFCIDEMEDYQALYEKHGDSVQFVMLNTAESAEEVANAREFIAEHHFTFPVFYDDKRELQEFLGVRAYPTTAIVSADGEVLSNRPGRIVTQTYDDALTEVSAQ